MRSFLDSRREYRRHGFRWWLDSRQSIDAAIIAGEWEPTSTAAVRRIVKPGMVVADVGANIGWYTVIMSGLVGPTGQVWSFEPMEEPRIVLQRHAAWNNLVNVAVCHEALSDRDTFSEDGLFNYSWPEPDDPVCMERSPVRLMPLDQLAAYWQRLDFIKIDVDGFEARILKGAKQTLQRLRPTLLLEICDYTLVRVEENPLRPSPDHGDARVDHSRYQYGDYTLAMLEGLATLGYWFFWEDDFQPLVKLEDAITYVDLSERSFNLVAKHVAIPR